MNGKDKSQGAHSYEREELMLNSGSGLKIWRIELPLIVIKEILDKVQL
jgi:hypothetical protein